MHLNLKQKIDHQAIYIKIISIFHVQNQTLKI